MPLRARLNEELKTVMKAKDERAVSTLRLILAALKDRDIAARGKGNTEGIDEAGIIDMLQELVRLRRESIHHYEQGGRPELARREAEEIKIIERYLPKPLGNDETAAAISTAIEEVGATSIKDMGRVMALLRDRYAGRMNFARAAAIVKQTLGQ